MNIKPVPAVSNDLLQQCLAVRKEVFVTEQKVPVELEMDEWDASWESCKHFLLLDGDREDRPVAAARYRMYDQETAKLQRIAVLASYRGLGLGRQIIEFMEQEIAGHPEIKRIVLDAQTYAEPFYAKLGYETVSAEPFLDAGIEHVRMEKRPDR